MEGSVSCLLPVALAFLLLFLTWIFVQKKKKAKEPDFKIYRKQCFLSVFHLLCLMHSSTFGVTPLAPDAASTPSFCSNPGNRDYKLLVPVPGSGFGFWFRVPVLGWHPWKLLNFQHLRSSFSPESFPTLPFHCHLPVIMLQWPSEAVGSHQQPWTTCWWRDLLGRSLCFELLHGDGGGPSVSFCSSSCPEPNSNS